MVSSPIINAKPTSLSISIKKCKDGTGDNWSVEPGLPPFYLMSNEPPVQEALQTGAKNLIKLNGLEAAYQKFCTKKLKEDLSAFLPNICGRVNVPASEDDSGLLDIITRPPVQGKELRPFAQTQLDNAFRLHPGPLPQEFSNLFTAVSNNEKLASQKISDSYSMHSAPRPAPSLMPPIPGTLEQSFPQNPQQAASVQMSYPNPPQLQSLMPGANPQLLKSQHMFSTDQHSPAQIPMQQELTQEELLNPTISLLSDDEPSKKRKRKKEKKKRERD
ncbi:Mediator complex subunit 19 [Cichlidogyrus casuarinus]|uniref:Mediator of RNA polymerase II transcription subunit 19 n=1 Tax=Cichlidogyrus casuarinus TaxID=1844966 RepID=A0ABD2QJS9_9PLAT